jgi:hypothetical protein
MSNATNIVNQAFILLGVETITSLDDNKTNAIRAKTIYDTTRTAILREYPHTCCIKEVTLGAQLAGGGYNLPNDCLRIIKVNKDYDLRGRVIYTQEENPTIRYIYDNKNEGTYSPLLVECLVYMLAFKLSPSILQKTNNDFYSIYKDLIAKEKAVDSQQTVSQQFFGDEEFSFKDRTDQYYW